MALLNGLLLVVAIVLAAVLPCAIAMLVVYSGEWFERLVRAIRRGARRAVTAVLNSRLGRRWQLLRLARALRVAPALARSEPTCPPIEQVASDLRRLSRQRVGIATRSPVWFTAVQRAYDERLLLACRQLDIDEHLEGLTGVDLELERVRLEGTLELAGFALRDRDAHQR